MSPFSFPTSGQAIRAFSDSVNNPETQFYRHASDFELWELGVLDQLSGHIESSTRFLVNAQSVLISENGAEAPTAPMLEKHPLTEEA